MSLTVKIKADISPDALRLVCERNGFQFSQSGDYCYVKQSNNLSSRRQLVFVKGVMRFDSDFSALFDVAKVFVDGPLDRMQALVGEGKAYTNEFRELTSQCETSLEVQACQQAAAAIGAGYVNVSIYKDVDQYRVHAEVPQDLMSEKLS